MMRILTTIFFTLLAGCVLVVGFFMPELSFAMQNEGELIEEFSVDLVDLKIVEPDSLHDLLRFFTSPVSLVEISTGSQLTERKASDYAYKALGRISLLGDDMGIAAYGSYNQREMVLNYITPFVAVSGQGESGPIIWQCIFFDELEQLHVIINLDDSSGKMISYQYNDIFRQSSIGPDYEGIANINPIAADIWAEFLCEYYDFKDFWVTDYAYSISDYDIHLLDDAGNILILSLLISDDFLTVSFNKFDYF